jgi:hypothetical protein
MDNNNNTKIKAKLSESEVNNIMSDFFKSAKEIKKPIPAVNNINNDIIIKHNNKLYCAKYSNNQGTYLVPINEVSTISPNGIWITNFGGCKFLEN